MRKKYMIASSAQSSVAPAAAKAWQRRDLLDLPQTATDAGCAAAGAAEAEEAEWNANWPL